MSKLACASGLYCLEQGRYKAAALKFTEVIWAPCHTLTRLCHFRVPQLYV